MERYEARRQQEIDLSKMEFGSWFFRYKWRIPPEDLSKEEKQFYVEKYFVIDNWQNIKAEDQDFFNAYVRELPKYGLSIDENGDLNEAEQ